MSVLSYCGLCDSELFLVTTCNNKDYCERRKNLNNSKKDWLIIFQDAIQSHPSSYSTGVVTQRRYVSAA